MARSHHCLTAVRTLRRDHSRLLHARSLRRIAHPSNLPSVAGVPQTKGPSFTLVVGATLGAMVCFSGVAVAAAFRSHVRAIAPPDAPSASALPPAPAKPPPTLTDSASAKAKDPCRDLFDQKKYDDADKACTTAIDETSDPDARARLYTTLGLVDEKRGQRNKAEHDLLSALNYGYSDECAEALARVSAYKAEAKPGTVSIVVHGNSKGSGLLRKDPRAASAKVDSLAAGTEVKMIAAVTSKDGTWVSVVAEGDKRGWVSDALVAHEAEK